MRGNIRQMKHLRETQDKCKRTWLMIAIINPVKVSNVMKHNTIVSLICQETPKMEVTVVILLPR